MWKLDTDRPIFLQIIEHIEQDIMSGVYEPGARMPSVRELAVDAAVNPNTMQKALTELERSGLVYSERTSGRFITKDEELIKSLKKKKAGEQIKIFLEQMKALGYDKSDVLKLINEIEG